MSKLFKLILVVTLPCAAHSCQSTSQQIENNHGALAADDPLNCDEVVATCDEKIAPMVCTVDQYDNTLLSEPNILKGWGSSVCEATSQLKREACLVGLDQRKFGEISCAPDPSEGECLHLSEQCGNSTDEVYCFASTYDGAKLRPDQIIAGRGAGECGARLSVKKQACLLNLRPSQLGNIACMKDRLSRSCPLPKKSCAGEYFPFICEGTLAGGILKMPFEARVFAENSCLAEIKLKQIACNLNISPDEISKSRCYAER